MFSVELGPGWRDAVFKNKDEDGDAAPTLLLRLRVVDAGGRVLFSTSDPWTASEGPVISSSVYDGETYDARLERDGWDAPGFSETWEDAVVVAGPAGAMVQRPASVSVKVVARLPAVACARLDDRLWLLDFGTNARPSAVPKSLREDVFFRSTRRRPRRAFRGPVSRGLRRRSRESSSSRASRRYEETTSR